MPRKFDYHPLAIPAPYNHSNINSDEVIYYVAGNFMSRRGVDISSFTVHPAGIPHGPHPGTVEASIGKEATEELAVMIDTFHPLRLTRQAAELDDARYPYSWLPPEDAAARPASSPSAVPRPSRTERPAVARIRQALSIGDAPSATPIRTRTQADRHRDGTDRAEDPTDPVSAALARCDLVAARRTSRCRAASSRSASMRWRT